MTEIDIVSSSRAATYLAREHGGRIITAGLQFKADSHYTENLLRPAIDGCKVENFPIFRSDLQLV